MEIYLDQDNLYTFGRGDKGQLGNGSKKNSDHPVKITIGDEKFKTAAVGRAHTIIVTLSGKVYGAGDNKFFQAIGKSGSDVNTFTLIPGFGDEKVVACSCGAEFSIVLTESGKMYTWGNPQYGQLGINATKEYIGPNNRIIFTPQPPTLIKMEANIVQVSAGINHAFCLDDKGQLYAWGFAGFGRLGLNHSPPKDVLVPTAIPGFLERNNPIKKVEAGQCCGLAIDSNNALHLWGKW